MTEVNIVAGRTTGASGYSVRMQVGKTFFLAKFDTGAKNTVISADVFYRDIPYETLDKVRNIVNIRNLSTKEFVSASGDKFIGYKVRAKNVLIGETLFPDFCYYLVLENKRTIALLGDDFIDHCDYCHHPHEDIFILGFSFEDYSPNEADAIDEDEILSL